MSGNREETPPAKITSAASGYRPPAITYLGTLSDLTRKTVGAADGATFLGLDIGSV